jgi:hypothetical protein
MIQADRVEIACNFSSLLDDRFDLWSGCGSHVIESRGDETLERRRRAGEHVLIHLEDLDNERRRQLAAVYAEALADIAELAPSSVPDGVEPLWHVYPVVIPERARIQAALDRAGIGTLVHYDPLPHLIRHSAPPAGRTQTSRSPRASPPRS